MNRRALTRDVVMLIVFGALLLALPEILRALFGQASVSYLSLSTRAVALAVLALTWDIVARTGQLSLAHAAFYGSGGYAAYRQQLESVINGGKLALLGIPAAEFAVDFNQVIFKGLTVQGIYGRQMFETWYKMAALLQAGLDITPVITHHFPVQEFQRGFETMGSGQSGKVILDWSTLN